MGTIIACVITFALLTCLLGWYGAIGSALFLVYAVTAKPGKVKSPVAGILSGLESGIGIIFAIVVFALLLSRC